ncbi:sodium-dependent transporter [Halarcobacter ebronensis]|uniref:Transporter n=1 Tax=Halarcobacter ebronensis TaxID=1462615 RepID=A0A4Q0YJN8_9BACT|nr:sodium-dependent transporter [Halarcobacter ebronensis]RXJ70084.1 sodium-dependent transporter [Halarcobacter ebronensis]
MNNFSRIGFILAAAGSAVGLGNIWKFPYITGEYGGGAFVLIYLIAVSLIGLTIFIAESYIGKEARVNAADAYQIVSKSKNSSWKFAGFQIVTGIVILSFYAFIIGWILNYILISFTGFPNDIQKAENLFNNLVTKEIGKQILFHTIVTLTVAYIIVKGVKEGIEKLNLILMPLLGLILFGLLIYSFTLDSFSKALEFMFMPNWDKVNENSILAAVGQAFFTLSLGMAIVITYSASMDKKTNFVKSSIMVAVVDTAVALVAGIIIFAFLFSAGAKSTAGPGLVFISLPLIFSTWGIFGQIVGCAFFVALLFAGITSAISLLEPPLMYLMERYKVSRVKGTILCSLFFYILGIFALLSMSEDFGKFLTFFEKNLFDWLDYLTSSIAMPISGFITCIFLGYFVDQQELEKKFTIHVNKIVFKIWLALIRYIVPIAIIILFLNKLGIIK